MMSTFEFKTCGDTVLAVHLQQPWNAVLREVMLQRIIWKNAFCQNNACLINFSV